jgi:hypothetical protein
MSDETDPTATLQHKLLAFADTLTDDEVTVLHEVLHLAVEGSREVEGFAMVHTPTGPDSSDPCEGGRITFPNTLNMLGALHGTIHVNRGGAGRPKFV